MGTAGQKSHIGLNCPGVTQPLRDFSREPARATRLAAFDPWSSAAQAVAARLLSSGPAAPLGPSLDRPRSCKLWEAVAHSSLELWEAVAHLALKPWEAVSLELWEAVAHSAQELWEAVAHSTLVLREAVAHSALGLRATTGHPSCEAGPVGD